VIKFISQRKRDARALFLTTEIAAIEIEGTHELAVKSDLSLRSEGDQMIRVVVDGGVPVPDRFWTVVLCL